MNEPIPFPRRAAPVASDIGEKLLGGLLDSKDPLMLIESSGLAAEDHESHRVADAWRIARRLAETRRPVNAATVFQWGRSARILGAADERWLEELQSTNTLDGKTWSVLAEDYRRQIKGRQLAGQLETLAREVRNSFNPGMALNTIDAMMQGIARDHAPDESAEGDVLEVLNEWDAAEKDHRSPLLPTRLAEIDKVITGLPPKMIVLAGPPGAGKTAVTASMIDAMLDGDPDLKLGLFGLEDGTKWYARRVLARDLKMPVRDIGWKQRTVEQQERSVEVGEQLFNRTRRLKVFRHDTITPIEMIRRATNWVLKDGVRALFTDNLSEVQHRAQNRMDGHSLAVAETVRLVRNFCERYQVPWVMLVHTARSKDDRGGPRPPRIDEMAESSYIEKRSRLILGLWQKKDAWRCTVLKATEGPPGATVEFDRHFEAAMIDREGGRVLNLEAEKQKELREKKEKQELETDHVVLERKARRAALEAKRRAEVEAAAATAPEKKPEDPQLALLAGVDQGEAP